MDTRNSRDRLLQSQNNSPQINSHSQPHSDPSSTSLLRHDEQSGQDTYGNVAQVKRPSVLKGSVLLEMGLCILALGWLGFAGLAIWMKDHPTRTAEANHVEQAMKLGSTFYVIVFPALLAAALKNIGRYFAQKGTTIMTLWALLNSSTMTGSIEGISTRPFLIVILTVAWLLSPLGSQSNLRLIDPFNSTTSFEHDIRYWDSGPLGNLIPYSWSCVSNDGGYPVSVRDLYLATMMQGLDVKRGHQDQWGNVKIPRLPDANSSTADADGWFAAPKGPVNPEQYSSLSGIAIIGLTDIGKNQVNFTLESAYVDLSCQKMNYMPDETMKDEFNVTCQDCDPDCVVQQTGIDRIPVFLGPPFPGLTPAKQANESITEPRSLLFQSTIPGPRGIIQAPCQVTQRLVETWVECIGNDCTATKIRPSTKDHRSANYTSFDYWGTLALTLISRSTAPDQAPRQGSGYITTGPSTAELFLKDSNVIPLPSNAQLNDVGQNFNLSSISLDVFEKRASTLLNTALQVFMCPTCFSGSFPSNLSLYGPEHSPADGMAVAVKDFNLTLTDAINGVGDLFGPNMPFMAASTNATVTSRVEVYKPNYPWIIVLVVCVGVVFILGVTGLILKFMTIIPNVFDPVMGLTYSNKYMPSTSEGILDAADRAKSVGDERVRFGAVEEKDMLARFMFGEERMVKRLNKKTWYYEST